MMFLRVIACLAVSDAAWDEATVTTFGYKNYGVRSDWLLTKNYDTAEPTSQHPQTQIKGIIQP